MSDRTLSRRHLLTGVAALASAAVLAACGDEVAPTTTASPATRLATGTMAQPALAKDLVYWVRSGDVAKVLDALAQDYGKERGVAVTVQVQGDYDEITKKIQAAIAANSLPHVSILGYRNGIPQVADSGRLIAAADLIAQDRYDTADFAPEFLKKFTYRGKLQVMPLLLTVPVLHYNATLFQAAGLNPDQPPQTWDDLVAAAKALTKREGNAVTQWGVNAEDSTPFVIYGLIGQAGGTLFDDRGQPTLSTPAAVAALQFWKDLVHVHRVMPPIQHKQAGADFQAGKLGMIMASASSTGSYEAAATGKFDYRVARFPANAQRSVPIGSAALGIFKSDPAHEALAWDFAKWMSRPAANARISVATGYLAIREATLQLPEIKDLLAKNPRRAVTLAGVREDARAVPINPADTVIWDGLTKAAEQLENDANADPKRLLDAINADAVKFLKEY